MHTTLLVLGDGAEDVRDELGRLVRDLDDLGPDLEVTGIDVRASLASCLDGTPDDLVAWALSALAPSHVLVIDLPDQVVDLPVGSGTTVSRLPRSEALALLRARTLVTQPLRTQERAPRVSVLIPVHNHASFLDATMTSVLSQTFDDFEVLAMDDGSTDESLAVLRKYESDPRVTVLTQPNIGRTGRVDLPCNRLIRAARGELLAWLGGDDVALPHRLAAQVEAFDEDPALDICHGAAMAIDADGRQLGPVWNLERAYDDLSALRDLAASNLVGCPSVMMRADAFHRLGLWEEGLGCDYHFWLKSAGVLRMRYLPRLLVEYRQHPKSLSTSAEGFPRAAHEGRRVRSLVLQRRSLADFFPELAGVSDALAWYEAGLALGNSLVRIDTSLAVYAYDLASAALPGVEADYNRAVAHVVAGERDPALAYAVAAAATDPAHSALVESLRSGAPFEVALLAPQDNLVPAMALGRQRQGDARRWDGTPVSVQRAYVGVDLAQPHLTRSALVQWCEVTRPESPVRWTIPTLGEAPEVVLAHIAAASAGLDLSVAGDLTLETLDDLRLLPPEPDRPTGVLGSHDDVSAFGSWFSVSGRGMAHAI